MHGATNLSPRKKKKHTENEKNHKKLDDQLNRIETLEKIIKEISEQIEQNKTNSESAFEENNKNINKTRTEELEKFKESINEEITKLRKQMSDHKKINEDAIQEVYNKESGAINNMNEGFLQLEQTVLLKFSTLEHLLNTNDICADVKIQKSNQEIKCLTSRILKLECNNFEIVEGNQELGRVDLKDGKTEMIVQNVHSIIPRNAQAVKFHALVFAVSTKINTTP
eukprot:UN28394